MRLSQLLNQKFSSNPISTANVNSSTIGHFSAVSFCQQQNIPVFAPYGISFLPKNDSQVLLLNVDGTDVCVGSLSDYSNLNSGELMLSSSGGAKIHLKSNGDIMLNGVLITADGQIIPPKQA